MSDLTTTHRDKPVLAYCVDADHFCVRCGVPAALFRTERLILKSLPCGRGLGRGRSVRRGQFRRPARVVTDEDDLCDVDSSGDPPEYRARWERCATCGESLDPKPMRLPWVK